MEKRTGESQKQPVMTHSRRTQIQYKQDGFSTRALVVRFVNLKTIRKWMPDDLDVKWSAYHYNTKSRTITSVSHFYYYWLKLTSGSVRSVFCYIAQLQHSFLSYYGESRPGRFLCVSCDTADCTSIYFACDKCNYLACALSVWNAA
jgi:hypothetical protein